MAISLLTSRSERNEPRNIPHKLQWRRKHKAVYWFALRLAQNTGLEFWQTINTAIMLFESMLADCLVKVAKRNLDVTEVSIYTSSRPSRAPCVALVCSTIVHHASSGVSHLFEIGRRPTLSCGARCVPIEGETMIFYFWSVSIHA